VQTRADGVNAAAAGCGDCDCLERIHLWHVIGADPALPDADFLAAAVHRSGLDVAPLVGKGSSAPFSSLPLSGFALNERLHFIISLKRST
jgi:hypothetical protein